MECKRVACSKGIHSIDILNFCNREEVPHSVVVVEGNIKTDGSSCQSRKVTVERFSRSWCTPTTSTHSISTSFHFKFILRLEQGVNTFSMRYCSVQTEFTLVFQPRNTSYCVLPLYVICKGHDGRFQAPEYEDNSIDGACDRIDVGIRLVQSLFAEKLKEGGFGRRTFQLQSDINPKVPDVNVFYSSLSVEDAHSKPMKDLWAHLAREIMVSQFGKENHKFVAFLSSTFYKGQPITDGRPSHYDILKCTDGYVAMGGGGLALLGTGCLHTWAPTIDEVEPRLTNNVKVDNTLFMDDSNYRGTYGGCYASTLGATCHEMGHIFGLGHTTHGIMGTEYHFIHQMFLPNENESTHISKYSQKDATPTDDICTTHTGKIGSRTSVQQISGKEPSAPKETHATKLVPELKVGWSVSEQKPPLRPKSLGVHSPQSLCTTKPFNFNSMQSKNISPIKEVKFQLLSEGCSFEPTFDCEDEALFWPQSCLTLLAHDKWINPNAIEDNIKSISCDTSRCISSTYGLQIVDLRADDAKSILHWRFSQINGLSKFHLPEHFMYPIIKSVFAIDSVGNVLKLNIDSGILSEI